MLDEIRLMLDLIEAHRQKHDLGYALLMRVRDLRDSISRMYREIPVQASGCRADRNHNAGAVDHST